MIHNSSSPPPILSVRFTRSTNASSCRYRVFFLLHGTKPFATNSRVTVLCSPRSLRTAVNCLLTAYTEDFRDPPHYSTLHHLLRHFPDRDSKKQCHVLLEQFQYDEENNPSNVDDNNNYRHQNSSSHSLANQRGLDYVTPCNILEMSSTMIAEQLTIVDAVCCIDHEPIAVNVRACF